MSINVLITGAGRGLGLSFVKHYLSQPKHTVIAAVRNPDSASSALKALPTATDSKLIIAKIDSISDTDPAEAVKTIKAAGITHLDIVIANAGVVKYNEPVHALDLIDVRQAMEINAFGPVKLFAATRDLLKAAEAPPKFIAISSVIGSTGLVSNTVGYNLSSYGANKAALNHFVRRIHFENEWLTAFAVHPGLVTTDMGDRALEAYSDVGGAIGITPDESVTSVVKMIDRASRTSIEGTHGFMNVDGSEMPY
ncbi:hypothetical protein QBC47DRAFT_391613 [Echria macrotheca]|uniref:Uncharacterized protein n=1 Tax=Echria macrotheca TaxID=438768 RepID=A0AAJ0B5S6_9PEZI|nr:hypothetical protein QBC47DRAFT_391613 [Echria macrotheca]